jgi:molybdate transport repressor ModE-like protein
VTTSERYWHGIEVGHLVAFEAVARERSFSAAARELGYTQPAISAQIARLEKAIGAALFARLPGGRGIELTEEGSMLLEHFGSVTRRLSAARADLESMQADDAHKQLVVGTFPSLSIALLPSVFAHLADSESPLEIELREDPCSSSVMRAVETGDLDAAFTTRPIPCGPFASTLLMHDPYFLVVRPDHPVAAEEEPICLSRLAELPLIAQPRAGHQARTEEAIEALGIAPRIVLRVDSWSSMCALVEAGEGFGLIPELALHHAPRLRALPLEESAPRRDVVLAWHAERRHTCALEHLIEASSVAAAALAPLPAF